MPTNLRGRRQRYPLVTRDERWLRLRDGDKPVVCGLWFNGAQAGAEAWYRGEAQEGGSGAVVATQPAVPARQAARWGSTATW